jgi:predicted outer membrane repeat protein
MKPCTLTFPSKQIFVVVFLVFAIHSFATEFLVYNTNDSGPGSLRQAILDNNATGGGNTILFSNGVSGTILLTSGHLLINRYLTIVGPGPTKLAINGNAASRVFHVSAQSGAVEVVISGLTITNGAVSGSFPGNVGGGVWNQRATLTFSNCVIAGNRGGGGPGGGIFNDASSGTATLLLMQCTLNANSTTNNGGGIYNYGFQGLASIGIIASTVSSNTAMGSGTVGGAVFNDGNFGIAALSVSLSTFSANTAPESGGAIYNTGASGNGSVGLIGSTFNGNTAVFGGAVFHNGVNGMALLTINNTLFKAGAAGTNLINNGGTAVSHGFNLSSDSGNGVLTNATDRLNLDPLLGPLADNGGPTLTHALLPGSPAIDRGKSFGETTDQRAEPRPFNFGSITNAAGGDGSDIGAFEVGRPKLEIQRIGNDVVLSWRSDYAGFTLQSLTNLSSSNNWMSADGSATLAGDQFRQTNTPISASRFFRLFGSP